MVHDVYPQAHGHDEDDVENTSSVLPSVELVQSYRAEDDSYYTALNVAVPVPLPDNEDRHCNEYQYKLRNKRLEYRVYTQNVQYIVIRNNACKRRY